MIEDIREAIQIATERVSRVSITLYIIEVDNHRYIICSDAFLPQLSMQYERFNKIMTIRPKG